MILWFVLFWQSWILRGKFISSILFVQKYVILLRENFKLEDNEFNIGKKGIHIFYKPSMLETLNIRPCSSTYLIYHGPASKSDNPTTKQHIIQITGRTGSDFLFAPGRKGLKCWILTRFDLAPELQAGIPSSSLPVCPQRNLRWFEAVEKDHPCLWILYISFIQNNKKKTAVPI